MGAFSPEEAAAEHKTSIPQEILDVVNALLTKRINHSVISIRQKEVLEGLGETDIAVKDVFDRGWLDLEDLYEAKGWSVTYDKPGYNETYDAGWTFKAEDK